MLPICHQSRWSLNGANGCKIANETQALSAAWGRSKNWVQVAKASSKESSTIKISIWVRYRKYMTATVSRHFKKVHFQDVPTWSTFAPHPLFVSSLLGSTLVMVPAFCQPASSLGLEVGGQNPLGFLGFWDHNCGVWMFTHLKFNSLHPWKVTGNPISERQFAFRSYNFFKG